MNQLTILIEKTLQWMDERTLPLGMKLTNNQVIGEGGEWQIKAESLLVNAWGKGAWHFLFFI